jgi:hypothetical protein
MHGTNGRLDSTNVKRYTVHENGATPTAWADTYLT